MVVGLYDRTDAASQADISDYLVNHFQDAIARVDGVGSSQIFGSQYAMRVWLDPYKRATDKLMPSAVQSAIAAETVEDPAGQIGDVPTPDGQQHNAHVPNRPRLQTPEQFRHNIRKDKQERTSVANT